MPKVTAMHQLRPMVMGPDTATTATLYLTATSLDMATTATLPMVTSPDMATTATLPMSPDMATTATLPMSPDMATTVTLRMSPDDVRCDVMLQIGGLVALWVRAVEGFNTF